MSAPEANPFIDAHCAREHERLATAWARIADRARDIARDEYTRALELSARAEAGFRELAKRVRIEHPEDEQFWTDLKREIEERREREENAE